ncbi:MAG: hypothetical protein ACPG7F_13425 [Aggregatilineales bacterium]
MSETYQAHYDAIFALMKTRIEMHEESLDWELAWMMVEIEPGHSMIYGRFRRENNPILYSFKAKKHLLNIVEALYSDMYQASEQWHGAKFILHRDGRRKADFRHDNFWAKLKKRLTGYYPANDGIENIVWGGLGLD